MSAIRFEIQHRDEKTRARTALLTTPHGIIRTPAFVSVATLASVRTLSPEEIRAAGSQVVLANTYHLYLERRHEVIGKAGGLAEFMSWRGPTMTDSGGFQVFSMGFGRDHGIGKFVPYFPGGFMGSSSDKADGDVPNDLTKSEREAPQKIQISESGVRFQSPREGDMVELSPEVSMHIQEILGADMIFAFDECTSPLSSYEYTKQAVERTQRWAKRSLDAKTRSDQALFGVIQGGVWRDLREESVRGIAALPFDGYGLGGPVGLTHEDIPKVVGWMSGLLPQEKPRHLLGMGSPKEILNVIAEGVDLFDCVVPTREARNGTLYTSRGKMHIQNAQFREDFTPIEDGCACYACTTFTRAYVHHLFRTGELLGKRLASIHNLFYLNDFVAECRAAIEQDSFAELRQAFISRSVSQGNS